MSIVANALWLLCGLAAVSLSALCGRDWMGRVALLAGFGGALLAIPNFFALQIETAGSMGVLGAAVLLVRPRYRLFSALMGGALAAILGLLIAQQSVSEGVAVPAASLLVIVPVVLAARIPGFVNEEIRDEALLGICGLGLFVALAPGLEEGWRSAVALNVSGVGTEDALEAGRAMPVWALWVAVGSLAAGALFRAAGHLMWRRS